MNTRVLVVDDELDTLNLLRTILEISGYAPITTLNSVDAVGLAEVEKPDVVLLDIMMPKLDGFTICKMMRQNTATQTLPIIFVTAYESLDIEDRRVEAGANKVINKPIDMDVLIKTINDVLKETAKPAEKPPVPAAAPADLAPAALVPADPAPATAVPTEPPPAKPAPAPDKKVAKTQEARAVKSEVKRESKPRTSSNHKEKDKK